MNERLLTETQRLQTYAGLDDDGYRLDKYGKAIAEKQDAKTLDAVLQAVKAWLREKGEETPNTLVHSFDWFRLADILDNPELRQRLAQPQVKDSAEPKHDITYYRGAFTPAQPAPTVAPATPQGQGDVLVWMIEIPQKHSHTKSAEFYAGWAVDHPTDDNHQFTSYAPEAVRFTSYEHARRFAELGILNKSLPTLPYEIREHVFVAAQPHVQSPTVAVRVEDLKKDEWSGAWSPKHPDVAVYRCCTVCYGIKPDEFDAECKGYEKGHTAECWKGKAIREAQ